MYVDRITFKNSRGLRLVGDLYTSDAKSIIIMSHGFTGDRHEWGRFDKIAESFHSLGYNVLAFDFSGCGESDDDSLTVEKQIDDLTCAIALMKTQYENIGLFGHSLGGLVSLNCYQGIKTMVLHAPLTDKQKSPWSNRYSPEQMAELKEKGYMTSTRDKGVRHTIIIDTHMFEYRDHIDPKILLDPVKCPVLIIHGDADQKVPLRDSEQAIKYLAHGKLEVIPGGDHSFNKIDPVIKRASEWFLKHLDK